MYITSYVCVVHADRASLLTSKSLKFLPAEQSDCLSAKKPDEFVGFHQACRIGRRQTEKTGGIHVYTHVSLGRERGRLLDRRAGAAVVGWVFDLRLPNFERQPQNSASERDRAGKRTTRSWT
jgi:hypothetical protein